MTITTALRNLLRPVRDIGLTVLTLNRGVPTTVNGVKMRVDARTRPYFLASYDPGVTACLLETVRSGDECWNVGANVGIHVLQLGRLVGPNGRVIAFEPNPEALALLRRNVALNEYTDRVELVQAAIGQHPGTADLFIAGANPMARPNKPNPLLPRTRSIPVPVTTLDEFIANRPAPPKCVVMDIEGWEIGALLGAGSILRLKPLPLILVELHPDAWSWSGHSREQLEDLLRLHGLRAVPLSGQQDVLAQYGQARLVDAKNA